MILLKFLHGFLQVYKTRGVEVSEVNSLLAAIEFWVVSLGFLAACTLLGSDIKKWSGVTTGNASVLAGVGAIGRAY